MITFVLLFIAGFFNACMDRLETGRPSKFPKKGTFWNKGTGRKILGYYIDGWHISKSAMLICIISSIYLYQPVHHHYDLLILCMIWAVSFNLFYTLLK